jgi:hypothetical protein
MSIHYFKIIYKMGQPRVPGRQGVNESAVRAKEVLGLIGTRSAQLESPSESRLSGARPTKAEVEKGA